jgi:hypothetical protein
LKYIVPALLLTFWLTVPPSLVRAEVSSANQNEAASAFQALDILVRQTRAQGDLPRWSNPDQAKVLGRFWDITATLGAPPYRSADVPALLTIGERSKAVFQTYVLFAPQNDVVPDTASNTFKYQDEITHAGTYCLRVLAVEIDALADFLKTLPANQMNKARRTGLRRLRLGIIEFVSGLTLMLRSPGLRAENRTLLLDSLSDTAAQLASVAVPVDRAAMMALIDTVLPSLSETERDKAQAFKSVFARQDCTGLCAIDAQ